MVINGKMLDNKYATLSGGIVTLLRNQAAEAGFIITKIHIYRILESCKLVGYLSNNKDICVEMCVSNPWTDGNTSLENIHSMFKYICIEFAESCIDTEEFICEILDGVLVAHILENGELHEVLQVPFKENGHIDWNRIHVRQKMKDTVTTTDYAVAGMIFAGLLTLITFAFRSKK
jgi:hypothetical protein